MKTEVHQGNGEKEYRELSAEETLEIQRVHVWRDRIDRAASVLKLDDRIRDAKKADLYMSNDMDVKGHKTYLPYLLPTLQELHRQTVPVVPTPKVEARTVLADSYESKASQFLSRVFEDQRTELKDLCDQFQWDDDRYGCFVAKVEWDITKSEAEDGDSADEERLAVSIDRAEQENLDPKEAKISLHDVDMAHISIHNQAIGALPPDMALVLESHIIDHQARLTEIKEERPSCRRVRPWMYVYDIDVPWEERTWEAELRSEKIKDLIDGKFDNINPENCPVEDRGIHLPYDDQTTQAWYIHDITNQKHFVVSAKGPKEGYFLREEDWVFGDVDVYKKTSLRPWNPDESWGMPLAKACLGVLDELAVIDYYIKKHVERHANYKVFIPDRMDQNKLKSGMNDPDQSFVAAPLEVIGAFKEYRPPAIPDSLLQQRASLLSELRRITGLDAQEMGASNPHVVSATESARRGMVADYKRLARQEAMADFLSWLARTYIQVARKFATLNVPVRTETGIESMDPRELPPDFDVYLDIKSETDAAKEIDLLRSRTFADFLMQSPIPVNYRELNDWLGKKYGVRRPDRFILQGVPEGPENIMQAPGAGSLPAASLSGNDRENFAPNPETLIQGDTNAGV